MGMDLVVSTVSGKILLAVITAIYYLLFFWLTTSQIRQCTSS